ncbi:Succinate-semialdehyde dehydrogenase [NADP(+)] 1 (plasmid) [Variovorax sp. RA8]|nr:Succinate-semialdehyde dehydrogenase [NADP(+)] 1 [Variovorax sp. RA8]
MTYQSVNPYDGKIVETFAEISDEQLETSLQIAAACFETWRHTTFAERTAVVARAAGILRARSEEFARPVTLEMGKLIAQARGEVALSADILDYYANNAETFLAPRRLEPDSGEAVVESSPFGVLFAVRPWNFPYYQLARFAAPNLMAGNVVMVKHAGCVPQCAIAFEKLWLDAGAPAGAYTNLLVSYDQVNRVIDDPRIKGVALTGSVEAGKVVAARAGQNLKKSTMELGGSDAFIVLEDADLDESVRWAVWGKMNNTGQCCVAAKRLIVVEGLADRFLDKFQTALEALEAGNPMDDATTLGPLSTEAALVKLLEQVNRAVAQGATLVMGGKRIDRPGAFMQRRSWRTSSPAIPPTGRNSSGRSRSSSELRTRTRRWRSPMTRNLDWGPGIHQGCCARQTRGEPRRHRHGVQQSPDLDDSRLAVRRHQELRLRTRALQHGIQEFVNKKLVRVASIDGPA